MTFDNGVPACALGILDSGSRNAGIFGDVFLRHVYFAVNLEANLVAIAQARWDTDIEADNHQQNTIVEMPADSIPGIIRYDSLKVSRVSN